MQYPRPTFRYFLRPLQAVCPVYRPAKVFPRGQFCDATYPHRKHPGSYGGYWGTSGRNDWLQRSCLALKRQHVFDQWQDVAARLRAPWMRCCRQADGPRRTHLGAVVVTHGLVVPIVVVAVPGHRYKILVECDEEVPLSSDADGRRRAVHARCVDLAVQVWRRRRLVRTSRSGSDRLMQGVVLIVKRRAYSATVRVDEVFQVAHMAVAEQAAGLYPILVAQECSANRLLLLLIDSRLEEASHLVETKHALVTIGSRALPVPAAAVAVEQRFALSDDGGDPGIR